MNKKNEDKLSFEVKGKVKKKLRDKTFLIEFNDGRQMIADVSSRFRKNSATSSVAIMEGSTVMIEITLKDPRKGQIIKIL